MSNKTPDLFRGIRRLYPRHRRCGAWALTAAALCLVGSNVSVAFAQKDNFKGVTIIFDAKEGKNGDFLDGTPRDIKMNTPFRVVILHPNSVKREYKPSYEKVEHHTATPPDFLKQFFASSPSVTSALDPLEVNRLTDSKTASGGASASTLLGSNRAHPDFGLPPELVKPYAEYQAAFKMLTTAIRSNPQFAKSAGDVRTALLEALQGDDNAAMRKTATEELAKVYNVAGNGLQTKPPKGKAADTFPTPSPLPIPLVGLKRKQYSSDYSAADIKRLSGYAKMLPASAQATVKQFDAAYAKFLKASNNLALALQRYRAGQYSKIDTAKNRSAFTAVPLYNDLITLTGGFVLNEQGRDNTTVFTLQEWNILLKEFNTLTEVTTLRASAAKKTATDIEKQAAVVALRKAISKAVAEKDAIADAIQAQLNDDNKIARNLADQKRKYLNNLAAAFGSYAKAYLALLDTDTLPTYDIAPTLNRTPGDAINITMTVTETDAAPALAAAVVPVVPDVNLPAETPPSAGGNSGGAAAASGSGTGTTVASASAATDKKAEAKDPLNKKTLTLSVHGRPVTDFTIGPFFTNLQNRNYTTDTVSGPGGTGQFVIKQGASDRAGTGLGVFVHHYTTVAPGRLALGFTLGTQVDKLDTFMAGGSLVWGSSNRVILTVGGAMGKTNVLNGVKVGQTIDQATPDTKRVYQGGYFVALTFALNLK